MAHRTFLTTTDDLLMGQPVRYFLLTVDDSPDSLRPLSFLGKLYHRPEDVGFLVCYFYAPLAPLYKQHPLQPAVAAKKEELLKERSEKAEAVLHKSRLVLMEMGVPAENIQVHLEERTVSRVQHSCSLAGIKKVDGVLVQKSMSGKLEELLRGDPFPALLQHCLASPVWFLDGSNIATERAVVCVHREWASLQAVWHAAAMLADTATSIDLLYCDPHLQWTVTGGVDAQAGGFSSWVQTPNGQSMSPYLEQSRQILTQAGIAADRVRVAIVPVVGNVASTVLDYCRQHQVGIAVLGHSRPHGIWSFFQNSVTKEILAEFKNMSIWVVQQGTRSSDEDTCC